MLRYTLVSSPPLVLPLASGAARPPAAAAAAPAPALSFELSKLWKKFWSTSCWVWPPVGLGDPTMGAGDVGERTLVEAVPTGARPGGRPLDAAGLRVDLRAGSVAAAGPPPMPTSISVRARSTLGKLKLLLPSGPTIPAAAAVRSAGLRKAPRGSRSGFFAFSS